MKQETPPNDTACPFLEELPQQKISFMPGHEECSESGRRAI
jgi:hypothetical protein